MIVRDPLFLLLIPVAVAVWWFQRRQRIPAVTISEIAPAQKCPATFRQRCAHMPMTLRAAALVCIACALARPCVPLDPAQQHVEGVDIVLAIDCSTSMRALDFTLRGKRVDRLAVVKNVIADFVKSRANDRIGAVAFSARPYMVCPLTLDYGWLLQGLARVQTGMIEDGTAIGSGLAASLNRLKSSQAKSKLVILLTDGVNNAGKITPLTAAETARALGIKVYTIGAGTKGPVPYPVQDMFGRTGHRYVQIDIDEDTLRTIAESTGGKYFRAVDTDSLKRIYHEIDALEKTPLTQHGYTQYRELFWIWCALAVCALVCAFMLQETILRRLP